MELEISCPGCHSSIRYSGEAPRFCQDCGQSLGSTVSQINNPDETGVAQSPAALLSNASTVDEADRTIAPSTDATDMDMDGTVAPTAAVYIPDSPSSAGEIVGPYQLVRWLGAGGMGTVWEAVETKTGRRVALKRLSKTMATDKVYVQRFAREAQLAAQISHPKVTFIYGSGSDDGQPFIAMELMPGRTLDDMVKEEGALSVAVGTDKIIDAVEGLSAAHALGMIHRDIKPSNCFLDVDESVKVGDFGLSKSLLNPDLSLTQTGTFLGTPSYAAPEQIRGAEVDARTDIYSVGASLFYVLTGRTPFVGDAMSVTAQIISEPAPPMRNFAPEVPKGLDVVVAKCLAKDPAKRFQTLEELRLALIPYASGQETIMGIGRRFAAFMIDQSLIYSVYMVSIFTFSIYTSIVNASHGLDPVAQQAKMQEGMADLTWQMNLFLLIINCLYFAILEGFWGRALGKRILGLRVVDSEGQSPGFFKMLVRTIGVPGCFGLCFLFGYIWTNAVGAAMTPAANMTMLACNTSIYIIATAICFSTMRTTNGLLGVHGLLSGTRVIQPMTGRATLNVPVVLPKPQKLELMRFGPYESQQLMGESQFGKVYFGHDEPLKRDVWVVVRDEGSEPKMERLNLARVTRQRWLEGGNLDDGKRWDAFEAINGIPVQTLVGLQEKGNWSHYQQVMADIVDEVLSSLSDNTLPETLHLPQVWLHKDGNARLLDRQLVEVVKGNQRERTGSSSDSSSIEQAVELVQDLGDLFQRTSVLPESAQTFIGDLRERPKTESTLEWAKNRLVSLSKQLPNITWDSRIGILATTLGVELLAYLLLSGLVYLFCIYVAPIPDGAHQLVAAALVLIAPAILGYVYRGGPVFHYMGIQVCNSRGLPASKFICGIRNAISWLPVVAMIGAVYSSLTLIEANNNLVNDIVPESGVMLTKAQMESAMLASGLIMLLSMASIFVGVLFSILSCKRGLVDFLLWTRLMPK